MSKKLDRTNKLIEILKEKNGASVKELANILQVSEMTIRRDLEFLKSNNIVTKVYGATIYNPSNSIDKLSSNYNINDELIKFEHEKNKIGKAAAKLIKNNDVIIIDTGAGISSSVMEFLVASPETILVTTPEPASITDSYASLKALSMNEDYSPEKCRVKLIANRVGKKEEGQNLYEKLSAVSSRFLNIELEYLGAIPFDNNITKAVMTQEPVSLKYPGSVSSKCYEDIVNILENKEISSHNNIGVRNFFKSVFLKK